MKKILVNKFLLFAVIVVAMNYLASAQNVTFNDTNFKNALLSHDPVIDTNEDGEIQVSEAEAFTGFLNLYNQSISDATGLEAFINITKLDISQNSLTSLDVTDLSALTYLYAYSNSLTALDVSQNTALDSLRLLYNSLNTIDLSNNADLAFLDIRENQLTSLDVTNNPSLEALQFSNNNISTFEFSAGLTSSLKYLGFGDNPLAASFDFTQFPNLIYMACSSSGLSSLDVSQMSNLVFLLIFDNPITAIDLSQNTALETLWAGNTHIKDLDLSNNVNLTSINLNSSSFNETESLIETVDLRNGNNEAITALYLIDNANLECILVDNPSDPFPNIETAQFDGFTNFTSVCRPISFSDASLESALLAHDPIIDINADDIISEEEAAAFTGVLSLSSLNIATAEELHYFTSATGLDISDNQLTSLNIKNGNNENFTVFDATGNSSLTCIKVDNATYSTENWTNIDTGASFSAYCDSDEIVYIPDEALKSRMVSYVDIDPNRDGEVTYGEALAFTGSFSTGSSQLINDMTGIEALENMTGLEIRILSPASISELDLTTLTQLTSLTVDQSIDGGLTGLDLSKNTLLENLTIRRIPVGGLDPGIYPNLTYFNCQSCELTSVDLSTNLMLETLLLYYNDFPVIDLSSNTSLTSLNLDYNNLNSLDVSSLMGLESLSASGNNFTELDVSMLTQLVDIELFESNVVFIDLSNSNLLETINIYGGDGTEGEPQRGKLEELILPSDPTELWNVVLEYNNLQTIDLSTIYFDPPGTLNNSVVYLYSNDLQEINIGNVYSLDISENPDLTCAQTTDVAYAEANYSFDEGVTFSTYCESKQNDIVSFVLAEQVSEAVINTENHSVGIKVEIGTDVTSLTPTITVSENATYSPEGSQDFSNTVVYTVTAEDGTSQDWDVTVLVGENTAPTLTTAFEDLGEEEGFSSVLISYANAFADADGHSLTISVESSDTDVVTAAVANDQIEITEVGVGTSTITVTASDGFGGSVSDEFTFTVTETPNNAPIVANPIADESLEEGFESTIINLTDAFSDQDGDDLSYTASSSNSSIAAVAITNETLTITEVGIGSTTITVTASDGNGASVSDEFTFTVTEAPLGLAESVNIKVYPNPAMNYVEFRFDPKVALTVDLLFYDVDGKMVKQYDNIKNYSRVDIRELPVGMYFIEIRRHDNLTIETRRIVVIR